MESIERLNLLKSKYKLVMNIQKKILVTLYGAFCCLSGYAQQMSLTPERELALHKKCIDTSAYIFEGIITKQECYYSKRGEILTCSVFQITKIYKGYPQIKLGTIEIITKQGGQVGSGPKAILTDHGSAVLGKGHYIIFGRPTPQNMQSDTSITVDNSTPLTLMGDPIAFSGKVYRNGKTVPVDQPAARWDNTKYDTVDDLNAFLEANGLTIEAAQIQQATAPADSTKH
jgi:hypothetical protein